MNINLGKVIEMTEVIVFCFLGFFLVEDLFGEQDLRRRIQTESCALRTQHARPVCPTEIKHWLSENFLLAIDHIVILNGFYLLS